MEYRTRYKRYFGTETKLLAQGFPRRAACIGNKAAAKPMLISHFHLHVPFVSLMIWGNRPIWSLPTGSALLTVHPCLFSTAAAIGGTRLKKMDLLFTAAMVDHGLLPPWHKWLRITCKEPADQWARGLPDRHLWQPSGVASAEHSRCRSRTHTNLPEWSYQVLSLLPSVITLKSAISFEAVFAPIPA